MNNKIEQRKIGNSVVKITSIKLYKPIAFFTKMCYDKNSRETQIKTKNKRNLTNMKKHQT